MLGLFYSGIKSVQDAHKAKGKLSKIYKELKLVYSSKLSTEEKLKKIGETVYSRGLIKRKDTKRVLSYDNLLITNST